FLRDDNALFVMVRQPEGRDIKSGGQQKPQAVVSVRVFLEPGERLFDLSSKRRIDDFADLKAAGVSMTKNGTGKGFCLPVEKDLMVPHVRRPGACAQWFSSREDIIGRERLTGKAAAQFYRCMNKGILSEKRGK